jgi:hypothetical protein
VVRATLVLCDFAEEVDGRLNLRGGVRDRAPANRPTSVTIVLIVEALRFELNTQHAVIVRLLERHGDPVRGENGRPVGARRTFFVDNTEPHLPVQAVPFVVSFDGLQLSRGVYRFVVEVDGRTLDERWLAVAADVNTNDELSTKSQQPPVRVCSKCGQLLAAEACPRCDR